MSDNTPRVYLARHGETEWTKNGRYTGCTDLELTDHGVKQVQATGASIVGAGKLIDPSKLAYIFISPRKRAQTTFNLLVPDDVKDRLAGEQKVTTTGDLAEWDYGEYEGLLTKEIRERRREHGLDGERPWELWRDGCEGGELPDQVTSRLDRLIRMVRKIQAPYMHNEKPADILLVAHGHILRAFTKRWLNYPMEFPLSMMIEPGGIGILSYQHHSVDEPAFLLGMAFPLDEKQGS